MTNATWTDRAIKSVTATAVDHAMIEGHYLDQPKMFRAQRALRNRAEKALVRLQDRKAKAAMTAEQRMIHYA